MRSMSDGTAKVSVMELKPCGLNAELTTSPAAGPLWEPVKNI